MEVLERTNSLDDPEVQDVVKWVNERLTVIKWAGLPSRPLESDLEAEPPRNPKRRLANT